MEWRYGCVKSGELKWEREPGQDKRGAEYATRLSNTEGGSVYREIYKRTKLLDGEQYSFDAMPNYRYDCLVTNDLMVKEWEAWEFYNGRANIENGIRELKNDYQLGDIVTSEFDANDVITQVTLLAYILMNHFKRKALPQEMARMQLGTLRWRIFNIPGRILWGARYQWTRLYNVFASGRFYAEILFRLKNLISWVLSPPVLGT